MKRQPSGFTLVELLVVITIIGILMGLLIPAVNAARETARRNQCATNMKNMALAAVQHDVQKKSLPGYLQNFGYYKPPTGGNTPYDPSDPTNDNASQLLDHWKVGTWAVALLPWLDAQPTYEHWTQDRYPLIVDNDTTTHGKLDEKSGTNLHPLAAPNLAIFQCPSNPVAVGSNGKNSMVYNNGMYHRGRTSYVRSQSKQNGIGVQKWGRFKSSETVTLDDLKDGQGFTVIISENVQALPWHRAGFANRSVLTNTNAANIDWQSARYTNGMVWHYEDPLVSQTPNNFWNKSNLFTENRMDEDDTKGPKAPADIVNVVPASVSSFHKINGGGSTVSDDIFNKTLEPDNAANLARPSSAHVDGVNCGFADGATRFVVSSINYRVYQAMMTPRGKSSLVPYPEFVLTDELGN